MHRPWQVWMWFALSLAVVVPAMGWLTSKALELDHQVTRAGREADLEEDISLALWRMDVALAPVVAQEAARPYLVYRPFLVDPLGPGTKGGAEPVVSPLLVQPSEFIRLHFEVNADGQLTSPQCPSGSLQELAVHNGAPLDNIQVSCDHLAQLSESIDHDALVKQLPEQSLPTFQATELAWNNRLNLWNLNPSDVPNEIRQQVLVQNDDQLQDLYFTDQGQASQPANVPSQSDDLVANAEDQAAQPNAPAQPLPQMAGPQQPQSPQGEGPPQPAQARNAPQQAAARWTDQYAGNFGGYGRNPRSQIERGQLEFQRRNKALQAYANTEVVKQRKNLPVQPAVQLEDVREGVSTALWVGSELLLARRVAVGEEQVVQGCWFDWTKLKEFLIGEGIGTPASAAALPSFDLRPIAGDRDVLPSRRLATLPVEIVIPPVDVAPASLSPIRLSLWIAWICMALAAVCVAVLLQGVVNLSERRGAFVSAVTHELRTPLTTFRMYAEMLSEGMVRDEQQQRQYTDTLRIEADRLSHLVENVLAYARLERGRQGGRRQKIELDALLGRVESRLADRAKQAGMTLAVEAGPEARQAVVSTDPQAVEQILFNLVDNACKYAQAASDRTILLSARARGRKIELRLRDHGPGISQAFAKRLFQPFSKSAEDAAVSAPGVGLGLALCRRLAREIGGDLELEASSHQGATFRLTLPTA